MGPVPVYTYSDMNGYGHFVPALFWAIIVLGLDLRVPRRGLDRVLPARRRGLARAANALAHRASAASRCLPPRSFF